MASLIVQEFEQTLGDSEGQGNLVCCSPWGHKESDTTEQLNCLTDSVLGRQVLITKEKLDACLTMWTQRTMSGT